MDRHGVHVHVLSLTAPGVQMFDADTATSLAIVANDRLAEMVRRHPTRYAALASFAPQDPVRATKEMERSIKNLKLNGFMVNSHTNKEYLDQQRYWPLLEAAEALDAPLHIHPRAPSDGMAAPFRDYRLEGAAWGYRVVHRVGTDLRGPQGEDCLQERRAHLPHYCWGADRRFRATLVWHAVRVLLEELLKPLGVSQVEARRRLTRTRSPEHLTGASPM